jgi:uncharacterized protein YecE (DUF72 family)
VPRSPQKPSAAPIQPAAISADSELPTSSPASEAASVPSRIYAGTSGWSYSSWKPDFYPPRLPSKRFLEHYGSQLNSVEVNYTFRALPHPSMLENWLAAVPDGFRFSFKAPERITHRSRLRGCDEAVAHFVSILDPVRAAKKLGLLLFQLPPNFKADVSRLLEFLSASAFHGDTAPSIAFEFRHKSWFTEETYEVLRRHNAALCIAESDDLQTPEVQCARTHACYRLRRTGGYNAEEIAAFADKFTALATDRDVYVYFKHEEDPTGALGAVAFRKACAEREGNR